MATKSVKDKSYTLGEPEIYDKSLHYLRDLYTSQLIGGERKSLRVRMAKWKEDMQLWAPNPPNSKSFNAYIDHVATFSEVTRPNTP